MSREVKVGNEWVRVAGVSSSNKFKTLGTNINRFAGILYATA